MARLGFRAISRVLSLLAWALGIKKAPGPQTIINWIMRLSLVRVESAHMLTGSPLSQAPFTNGLIWMLDIRIGLGSGKIVAVLALDAQHHHLLQAAPSLDQVRCLAVSVAESWTGEAILKPTILACLAPPTVRTKARFMHGHRLFTWADRGLKLSPPGGAKSGSTFAKLRACLDQLPACKALIRRFRADASGLLACQKMLKSQGLSHDRRAHCEPLIDTMPSSALRQEFRA